MEKQKILNAISLGETKTALELLFQTVSSKHENYHELLLLSARFHANESLFRSGLLEADDYSMEVNKLNNGLIGYVNALSTVTAVHKNADDSETIKLLFLASQPRNTLKLKIEEEYLEIRKSVKRKPIKFEIAEELDVTLESFFNELKKERPAMLQFSGHGTKESIIFSKTEATGQWHEVPWEYLMPPFNLIADSLECIFMHTLFSDDTARKLSKFIPCTIGVKGVLIEEDAIKFPSAFYASLAANHDYKSAFDVASEVLSSRIGKYDLPLQLIGFNYEEFVADELGKYCMYIDGEEYIPGSITE